MRTTLHPIARALPKRRAPHRATSMGLVVALIAPVLQAQTTQGDTPNASPIPATLPAVTVTTTSASPTTEGSNSYTTPTTSAATRLPLALRETPQAVTVVTRQQMDDQQLTSTQAVLEQATGLVSRTLDSERVSFHSRGFEVDSFQYDGIPTSFVNGASFLDTAFYDRIEIVRGATGLLSGTGNPSASINLVRKKPGRAFSANGSLSLGSWSNYRAMLDLSSPLTQDGRVRTRLVSVAQDRESHIDRYEQNKAAFYGTVEVDLTPDTLMALGYDYQRIKPKGVTWGGVPLWFSDGTPTRWSRSKSMSPQWSRWDNTLENAFARVEHRFDNGWSINASFNHQRSESDARLFSALGYPDRSTGLGMLPITIASSTPARQNNLDAMASGPFELFGRRHELVVGAMASSRKTDDRSSGFIYPTAPLGSAYTFNGQYPQPDFGAAAYTNTHTEIEQQAIYSAVRLTLSDPLKLILGGRVTRYELDQRSPAGPSHYKKSAEITPYAGAVYELGETYSVYASYTEIFNPQTTYRNRANQVLPPTQGKNVELGVKGEYFNGRLNAGLALFETRLDNLAQAENFALPTGGWAYYAASGTKSRGIELDLQGELTKAWSLYGGVAHFTASDSSGARLSPQQPRTTARLFTTYRLGGDWSKLSLGGGLSWQSRTLQSAISPAGAVDAEQTSYAQASLMAKYRFNSHADAILSIQNLTDRRYAVMNGFYNQAVYGAPRNAMLTLNYKL